MNFFKRKKLKGNVVVEMSVVFPVVLLVVLTLLVVVIYCFYQSHMKITNETQMFTPSYSYEEIFSITQDQISGTSHWDSVNLFNNKETMFSTNSMLINERFTMLFRKEFMLPAGSYMGSDTYYLNKMTYSDIMLVLKAMNQGD